MSSTVACSDVELHVNPSTFHPGHDLSPFRCLHDKTQRTRGEGTESIHFGFYLRIRCCGSDVPLLPTINILYLPDSSPISGFERTAGNVVVVGASDMVVAGGKEWRGHAGRPRGLKKCEEC